MRIKLLLVGVVFLLIVKVAFGLDLKGWTAINSAVTEDVYKSSSTCAGGFAQIISTFPVYFDHLNVSWAAGAGSNASIYDSRSGTTSVTVIASSINVTALNTWWYMVNTSSGLAFGVDNKGGGMPCLDFIFRVK